MRARARERESTLKRRSEVREREEVVEAPELGAGVAHLPVSVRGGLLGRRARRRQSGGSLLGGGLGSLPVLLGAPVLRVRTALPRLGLGKVLAPSRRRAEARRAGDDVQEAPHVRHRALFVVVLCFPSTQAQRERERD